MSFIATILADVSCCVMYITRRLRFGSLGWSSPLCVNSWARWIKLIPVKPWLFLCAGNNPSKRWSIYVVTANFSHWSPVRLISPYSNKKLQTKISARPAFNRYQEYMSTISDGLGIFHICKSGGKLNALE